MRETKFRAWDSLNRQMVFKGFGLYDYFRDELEHSCAVIFPQGDTNYAYMNGLENCPEPWQLEPMQYTGLKDKNGVEIYEGDIVAYRAYSDQRGINHKIVVKWHVTSRTCGFNLSNGHNGEQAKRYEVIGNIYENPELLNE